MANLRLAMETRNELAQVFQRLIDATESAGEIWIHGGEQPNFADAPTIKPVLSRLTFAHNSAAAATDGVLEFEPIAEDDSAKATGVATWARIVDGDGNTVFDCDVSDEDGRGTIRLNTVNIVAGGPVRLRSFTLTTPAG